MILQNRPASSAGIAHRMFQITDGEFLDGFTLPAGFVAAAVRYEGSAAEIEVTLTGADTEQAEADRRTDNFTLRKGYIYSVMFSGIRDKGTATSTETDAADILADATLPGVDTSGADYAAGVLNALTIFGYNETN